MQQKAIEKITDSMATFTDTQVPAEPIAEYLKSRCSDDEEFATLVMQEHKTMAKCFDFVYEQAKKHLNGSNGWINDKEVYLMAADYFQLDDEELERKAAEERAGREEKEEEARKHREADARQKADAAKARKDADTKQKAAASKVIDGQMSLFD